MRIRAEEARKAHNLEVVGSNPASATKVRYLKYRGMDWRWLPAESHKLNDGGSNPSPATNTIVIVNGETGKLISSHVLVRIQSIVQMGKSESFFRDAIAPLSKNYVLVKIQSSPPY